MREARTGHFEDSKGASIPPRLQVVKRTEKEGRGGCQKGPNAAASPELQEEPRIGLLPIRSREKDVPKGGLVNAKKNLLCVNHPQDD